VRVDQCPAGAQIRQLRLMLPHSRGLENGSEAVGAHEANLAARAERLLSPFSSRGRFCAEA
jgi:hypothetical protein